jgi:hypothetical protein
LFALLAAGCATNGNFSGIDNAVAEGKYPDAVERLDKDVGKLYNPSRDRILFYLDKGMLSHYAKTYTVSSAALADAERAIEEAYTKSISQMAASQMTNENALEYPGEDYEDVYINIFNALNYYNRGNVEGAMVEIRRMHGKIQYLSTKYDVATAETRKMASEGGFELPDDPKTKVIFSDSALARYMGMLLYRSQGNYDDVRIDYEGIQAAFANSPAVYNFSIPSTISGDLRIPEGQARLNVIAFSGLAPIKKKYEFNVPMGSVDAKVSFPVMESRPTQIDRIELVIQGGQIYALELLEDIDAVARATFETRKDLIYARSLVRAMVRTMPAMAIGAAADAVGDPLTRLLAIGAQRSANVREEADIRLSRYFPGRASVIGVNLNPGTYTFDVVYKDKSGKTVATEHFRNFEVNQGTLNLVESYSLK